MLIVQEIQKRFCFVRAVLRELILGIEREIGTELPVCLCHHAELCISAVRRVFGDASGFIPNLSPIKPHPQPRQLQLKPSGGINAIKCAYGGFEAGKVEEVDVGTVAEEVELFLKNEAFCGYL